MRYRYRIEFIEKDYVYKYRTFKHIFINAKSLEKAIEKFEKRFPDYTILSIR